MQFIPRSSFSFPLPPSWYAGHMHSTTRKLVQILPTTDVILELRDARLPLSSTNTNFERIISQGWGVKPVQTLGQSVSKRRKITVLCKRDLADSRMEKPVISAIGGDTIFVNTKKKSDVLKLLKLIKSMTSNSAPISESENDPKDWGKTFCVAVGMPNVGKSSLVNALRNFGIKLGKVSKAGPQAGMTTSMQSLVKISQDPLIYLVDSPGVNIPYFGREGGETAYKLALTGGIKEGLIPQYQIADYLLYRLNQRDYSPEIGRPVDSVPYMKALPFHQDMQPTNDIEEFLVHLAVRSGKLGKGGIPDLERAAEWFIEAFRSGKFGGWTLDEIGRPPPLALPTNVKRERNLLAPPPSNDEVGAIEAQSTEITLTEEEKYTALAKLNPDMALVPLKPGELSIYVAHHYTKFVEAQRIQLCGDPEKYGGRSSKQQLRKKKKAEHLLKTAVKRARKVNLGMQLREDLRAIAEG